MENETRVKTKGPYGFDEERVIHDSKQIIDINQLAEGKTYQRMHVKSDGERQEGSKLTLIAIGRFFNRGHCRVINHSGEKDFKSSISLADCGVIPYGNGRWNIVNYLMPVEE